MRLFFKFATLVPSLATCVMPFPAYGSLAGLSEDELAHIIPTLNIRAAEPAPGPLKNTSKKLVNDEAHPWKPLQPGDIRGTFPGLNTLASHVTSLHSVATPGEILNADQEGFNMGNYLAIFVTYAAFLVDIKYSHQPPEPRRKERRNWADPPKPAIVRGLNTHAVFEGDASTTRADAFLRENHDFNETLFEQFSTFSNQFEAGNYNMTVAVEYIWHRVQDLTATNPELSLVSFRYLTVYVESVFPIVFFVDGRIGDDQLSFINVRGFFQNSQFPKDFHRSNRSVGMDDIGNGISQLFLAHPFELGSNYGAWKCVRSYNRQFSQFCLLYTNFFEKTVARSTPTLKDHCVPP